MSLLRQQLDFLEDSIETDVSTPRWRKSRERKAVALEQARLQSLSIMSFGLGHELRQPLQSIRFEAENIAKRVKQLKIQDQDIAEAQRNIDADIERIDKNIKMIASISSGSLEQSQEIDVARIIDDQARLFETRCAAHGIELDVQVGNHAPATANETLIGIVVVNLIKNAIDALVDVDDGRKKKIVVTLRDEGSKYAVDIADNALGIPGDIQGKIFKKFGTRKTGGWGVGLYNCKLFLQSHGGDISFHTDPGAGTTFTFTLPKVGINANTSPRGG